MLLSVSRRPLAMLAFARRLGLRWDYPGFMISERDIDIRALLSGIGYKQSCSIHGYEGRRRKSRLVIKAFVASQKRRGALQVSATERESPVKYATSGS